MPSKRLLTLPGGQRVSINPEQVTTVTEATEAQPNVRVYLAHPRAPNAEGYYWEVKESFEETLNMLAPWHL